MRRMVGEAAAPLTARSRLATVALIGALAVVLLAGAFTPVKLTSPSSSTDPPSTSSTGTYTTGSIATTTTATLPPTSSTGSIQTTKNSQSNSSSSTFSSRSSSGSSATFSTVTATTGTSLPRGTVQVIIPIDVGTNESLNFQPSVLKVVVGVNNTIVWEDLDATQHTVKAISVPSGAERFDSGILNEGQSFTVTLAAPGTYKYDCSIHPDWMIGTIRVLA